MEFQLLVIYQWPGPTVSLRVLSSITFDTFQSMLANKGVTAETIMSNMFYTLPNNPECGVFNEEDWGNMIFHLHSTGIAVVICRSANFVEQRMTTLVLPNVSGSHAATGSNTNCQPQVLLLEQSDNIYVPDICVPQIDIPHRDKKKLLSACWANYIEGEGQQFKGGVIELRSKLAKYCLQQGHKFKFMRNTQRNLTAECANRKSLDCQWFLNASKLKHNKWFEIRVFRGEHTCPVEVRADKRLSSTIIALLIVDKVKENPSLNAPDVVSMFKGDYGLTVEYKQAWRAIDKAKAYIYGKQDDSYQEMKLQLHNLNEANPGSHIEYESAEVTHPEKGETKNRFVRAFVAFQASIEGFAHCRPLLSIDGTFLSGRYEGVLLAATAKDGDNGLFPVAFAIVASENKENWKWFLDQLLTIIPSSRNVIFVSDRNTGLVSLFENEFSYLTHFYCLHHLKMNLRARFTGPTFSAAYKESAASKLSECARAPTPFIFNEKLEELRQYGVGILNHFLQGLPLEKWAFSFAPCDRFGEMTSNASESYNNWIKKPRQLMISQCVNLIRSNTMAWFYERRTTAASWRSDFCPAYQKRWDAALHEAKNWLYIRASKHVFEFLCEPTVSVNIEKKECDCYAWEFSGFPCIHGIMALHLARVEVDKYVDAYYFADTYRKCYAGVIYPVTTIRKITHPVDLGDKVFPPDTVRKPGRPPVTRIMSTGEPSKKRQYRCSNCNSLGHPSRSCKAPISG